MPSGNPTVPPGTQPPAQTQPTLTPYQNYLAVVDTANTQFNTAIQTASQQFSLDVLTASADAANSGITLANSMDSIATQEIAALNTTTAQAYSVYTTAWTAANGNATLRQQAAQAYMTASQAAVDLANTNLNAALALKLPAINGIRTTMATSMTSAGNTLDAALLSAISSYQATESAAWQGFVTSSALPQGQVPVQTRFEKPAQIGNQNGGGLLPPATPPVTPPPNLGSFRPVPDYTFDLNPITSGDWYLPPPTALSPFPTVDFRRPITGATLFPITVDAGPGKIIIGDWSGIKFDPDKSKVSLDGFFEYKWKQGNWEMSVGTVGGSIEIDGNKVKIVSQPVIVEIKTKW